MNYRTAAIVGGAAFLLSALAGLIGGVPFFDLLFRAVFWALVGFGGSLGVEALMRSLLPDLFTPPDEPVEEGAPDRRVDIVLDDDRPRPVFEEIDDEPVEPPGMTPRPSMEERVEVSAPSAAPDAETPALGGAEADEEMPEIGTFLDAFKPSAPAGEEDDAGTESAGGSSGEPSGQRSGSVSMDGEEQDPVILAKAIQTVMKRDGQGT